MSRNVLSRIYAKLKIKGSILERPFDPACIGYDVKSPLSRVKLSRHRNALPHFPSVDKKARNLR